MNKVLEALEEENHTLKDRTTAQSLMIGSLSEENVTLKRQHEELLREFTALKASLAKTRSAFTILHEEMETILSGTKAALEHEDVVFEQKLQKSVS